MTVNGHAYQLPILELGTYVIGGGQLPTPSATEYKGTCRTRFRGSEDSRMSRLVEGLRVCSTDPQVAQPRSARLARILMGFPARVDRLKALGNAVVPQVAMVPLARVLELDQQLNG
jgi:hypothetical protein